MRSSGAVTVLAAAPAIAPAAKSAASLGTNATATNGWFKSCSNVGDNSFSSASEEMHAKFGFLPLPRANNLDWHW